MEISNKKFLAGGVALTLTIFGLTVMNRPTELSLNFDDKPFRNATIRWKIALCRIWIINSCWTPKNEVYIYNKEIILKQFVEFKL